MVVPTLRHSILAGLFTVAVLSNGEYQLSNLIADFLNRTYPIVLLQSIKISLQRQNGITTIHVTHDQEEALSIADRVAFLKDGRLVQVDTPKNLYDHPKTIEVANFVGRSNLIPVRVVVIDRIETPFGVLSCDTKGFASGSAATALIRPEAILLYPSLEAGGALNGAAPFPCRVIRDRFLGPVRRVDVEVKGYTLEAETMWRGNVSCCVIQPNTISLF